LAPSTVAPAATAKPLANVRREIIDGESLRKLRVIKILPMYAPTG
jgi:hypothetical protein